MTVQRLITDAEILAGRVTSPIVLEPGTLLTPAARDRAVVRGMVIVEVDARVAPPATPSAAGVGNGRACGCTCGGAARGGCGGDGTLGDSATGGGAQGGGAAVPAAIADGCGQDRAAGLATLGDGLYLVRVVGGRTVAVHRAADTGNRPGSGAV